MIRRISKKEATAILSAIKHQLKPQQGSLAHLAKHFLLDDGRFLVDLTYGNESILCDSEMEFVNGMKAAALPTAEHILARYNIDENFPQRISVSIKHLSSSLSIPKSALNCTFNSLKIIDEAIHAQSIPYEMYFDLLYIHLVGYVGQCIVQEKKALWEMSYDEKDHIWEPFIILPNGKKVPFFIDLFDEAQENYQNLSIYATAQLRLDNL